jgi:starch synthase
MKIAICASEVVPFAKTGGLADVGGALPLALEKLGEEVIIVMPGYKKVHELKSPAIKTLKEGVSFSQIGKGIKVYFIDNDQYFNRPELYGDKNGDFKDNLDRFSYYSKKTLE